MSAGLNDARDRSLPHHQYRPSIPPAVAFPRQDASITVTHRHFAYSPETGSAPPRGCGFQPQFVTQSSAAGSRNKGWIASATLRLIALLFVGSAPAVANDTITGEQSDFFEANIRPLLIDHCYECHSRESGESAGDLRLDSAAAVLQGGSLGPALVAKQPDSSLLVRAVSYEDSELQMPPAGKLDDSSVELIRRWIAMGAPDPRGDDGSPTAKVQSPLDRDPLTHWAFQPPQPAAVDFAPADTARDLIDAVAYRRAVDAGLQVAAEASNETLIRRLYYDLTGLPPSREAIAHFVSSSRPDAYMRLVDSLLATPDFGQRFGRYWMDVSRYADTVGYALAGKTRRHAGSERFRDWTIRAFATDMPYDEMLRHQLAGDRTDPDNKDGNLDAMGFLTLGRKFLNPLDTLDDRIDVISRGLLGMTVTCARCHDHKFDPIPTSDYYSMAGILFSSEEPSDGVSPLMLVDKKNPVDSPVLIRGQLGNRGPIAPRQFLTRIARTGRTAIQRWQRTLGIGPADRGQ